MKEYNLYSIHCANCARRMEAQLQQLPDGEQIRIDLADEILYVPNGVDMDAVKKILNTDKIFIDEATDGEEESVEPRHDHHAHGHHHGHSHAMPVDTSTKMKIVFFINVVFSISEFIFGFLFNSAAILSDAVHDLGDSLSIGLAWFFETMSTKESNEKYSFGHRRFSLLGALSTSIVLIVGSILILFHSVPLLFNPEPVNSQGMFWLSIAAIAVNGFAMWLLSSGTSANERVLSLHMLEDVLGWVGVLVVSIILQFTDWYFLDPLLSIFIALFILKQAIPGFLRIGDVFLESVPHDINIENVENKIYDMEHIHGVSHLHIWSIDGEENALNVTVYVSTTDLDEHDHIRENIRLLMKNYNVTHSTIEVVSDPECVVQRVREKANPQ